MCAVWLLLMADHVQHSTTGGYQPLSADQIVAVFASRLRLRLVKLGCISLETGLLGNKALSVIKLLKPYKLKVRAP
jgi:hypothetical protein